jgi:hypothetical protein
VPAAATLREAVPRRWEVRTNKCSCLDGGRGCRSPPHRVEPFGLVRDGGRRAPASIRARMRVVPVVATPHRAIPGLACDSGRRAPAAFASGQGWGCRPPPHLAEPFSDLPAMVGGAHRQASAPTVREKRNEEDASKEEAVSRDVAIWAFALASNNPLLRPSGAPRRKHAKRHQ